MKILMITPEYPYPTDNGAKRRIAAAVEFFSKRHHVSLVSLREDVCPADVYSWDKETPWKEWVYPISRSKGLAIFRSIVSGRSYRQSKFWNKQMAQKVKQLLASEHFDVIWVHFLSSTRFLEDIWDSGDRVPLLLVDQHNVFSTFWDSFINNSSSWLTRLYAHLEREKANRLQSIWFPRCDMIAAVSQQDLEDSLPFLPESQVSLRLVPNGVDLEYFDGKMESAHSTSPQIVFVGSMDALMNQEAVIWFADQIWGRIREQVPECEFLIVGRNPSSGIQQLAQRDGIVIIGNTPDVRPYFSLASVCVIPIHLGGGTKLKVLEAMAMELPIVSTLAGSRGLDVSDGEHLYLADDPQIFASRVVELLRNQELAQRIGKRGRKLVIDKYNWNAILLSLESELKVLMGIDQREIRTE